LHPCIYEFPRPSRYISGSRQQDASSIFRGPLADLGTGKITSEAQKSAPSGLLTSTSNADHRGGSSYQARETRQENPTIPHKAVPYY
jgi:hypothetical protein